MKKTTVKPSNATEIDPRAAVALPDLSAPPKGVRLRSGVRAGLLPCGDGETC